MSETMKVFKTVDDASCEYRWRVKVKMTSSDGDARGVAGGMKWNR